MRFSVVIPTAGRPDPLRQTLDGLLACEPRPDEVVIVDGDQHGSAREVAESLAGRAPGLSVRYVRTSQGASVQRQACLEAATGDAVVFIDDDALADRLLFAVLEEAYRDPAIVGATGRIVQGSYRAFGNQRSRIRKLLLRGREGSMTRYGYPLHLQDLDTARDVEFMQGCLMSARRQAALRVGFDPALGGPRGVALLEDEDFSYRLSRLGRIRYLPDAVVHHMALGFRARNAREYSRLIAHDRAYLLQKNFEPTVLRLIQFGLLVSLLLAHRLVNREWGGVLGLYEGIAQARRERLLRPSGVLRSRRSSRRLRRLEAFSRLP